MVYVIAMLCHITGYHNIALTNVTAEILLLIKKGSDQRQETVIEQFLQLVK